MLSENGVHLFVCEGRIDIAGSAELDAPVVRLLGEGATRVVIDLAGVDYISSAGLRSLLVIFKKAMVARARVALASPGAAVMEILELSGFKTLMNVRPDRESAIRATAE